MPIEGFTFGNAVTPVDRVNRPQFNFAVALALKSVWLTVRIKSASGQILQTLKTYSNLQAGPGYHLQTFNLTAFKGKTIRIELVGQEDNGSMTSFVVDDFRLLIET